MGIIKAREKYKHVLEGQNFCYHSDDTIVYTIQRAQGNFAEIVWIGSDHKKHRDTYLISTIFDNFNKKHWIRC